MKKMLTGALIVVASLFMLSAPNVMAEPIPGSFCKGDFDYDGNNDADDLTIYLEHFGREESWYPCPSDGPAPVPKTGQITSYATGDDGDLEKGVPWPNPRFTANVDKNGDGDCDDALENCDGTVTDNLTGLIWLKNANCFGLRSWNNALSDSNGLEDGECGLTDGSNAGDWRLPNYKELFSLVDPQSEFPALPSGYPFTNVSSWGYWSSTTTLNGNYAWLVDTTYGEVTAETKTFLLYVWPVRGGH